MSKPQYGYPGVQGPDAPIPDTRIKGTTLGQGSDSRLVRTDEGEIILTDKDGYRRTK